MATAFEVMASAKKMGASLDALTNFKDWMKRSQAEELRANKAASTGALGSSILGSIGSFLTPALLGATGLFTGGLGSMLASGLAGTAMSKGSKDLGDYLARTWAGAGGKEMRDIGEYKSTLSPYGGRYERELKTRGEEEHRTIADEISQLSEIEDRNRWISSAFTGALSAGKVKGGYEEKVGELTPADLSELGDEQLKILGTDYFSFNPEEQSITDFFSEEQIRELNESLYKDLPWYEKAEAALKGDVAKGYQAGFKDTSKSWTDAYNKLADIDLPSFKFSKTSKGSERGKNDLERLLEEIFKITPTV